MQRNKSLTLITQIFNKFSSKTFVSKACEKHSSFLPIYICLGCFDTNKDALCQECFKLHACDNKNKFQISRWVSQQQQQIGKLINTTQRNYQITKQKLLTGKFKVSQKQNQKSVSELNNQIIVGISNKLQKSQKNIEQNCIKPSIEGSLKSEVQNYLANIKIQVDGLSGKFSQITELVDYCQKTSKITQANLKKQSQKTFLKCCQLYIQIVQQTVHEVLDKIFDVQQNIDNQRKIQKQKINVKIANTKVQTIQKYLNNQKSQKTNLQEQIKKIQQSFKLDIENLNKKYYQQKRAKQTLQTQLQKINNRLTQAQKKIDSTKQIVSQNNEKETKIKKLQIKCKLYEQQLSEYARTQVTRLQKPQSRYNMEDMAVKLQQMSQKYQNLIAQCNDKDKKISELNIEINKLQIKTKQQIKQIASLQNRNQVQVQYRSPSNFQSPSHSNASNLTPNHQIYSTGGHYQSPNHSNSHRYTPNHQLYSTPNHQGPINSLKKQQKPQ